MNLITVSGVRGYIDENGTAWLRLEDVARGLGFTTVAASGNECVRWARVEQYLTELGFNKNNGYLPDDTFIPENIFYRLAMKARNEVAEKFQAKVADEILPSIRKTGSYSVQPQLKMPSNYAEALRELAATWEENQRLLPKAEYFDALVERNLLTNFRDTAKELKVKEQTFIKWLTEKGYIYRDQKGKLKAYSQFVPSLFEYKEQTRDKWAGVQTLITPKGRETFRLLLQQRELTPVK